MDFKNFVDCEIGDNLYGFSVTEKEWMHYEYHPYLFSIKYKTVKEDGSIAFVLGSDDIIGEWVVELCGSSFNEKKSDLNYYADKELFTSDFQREMSTVQEQFDYAQQRMKEMTDFKHKLYATD